MKISRVISIRSQFRHMLVTRTSSDGGEPPFSMTLSELMFTPEQRMSPARRDPTSFAAYTPAGLLVLYVLIRLIF